MYEIQERMPDGRWMAWPLGSVAATFESLHAALRIAGHQLKELRTATLRSIADAEANRDWLAVAKLETEYQDIPYRVVRVAEDQVEVQP